MDNNTKREVLNYLGQHTAATSRELCEHLGISRQALNQHIRELINSDLIVKTGATRAARYYLAKNVPKTGEYKKTTRLGNLDESKVYAEIATILNLKSSLSTAQESIVNYAFTEILNNAIDHSGSTHCDISFSLSEAGVEFEIRDQGIGLFESIASKFSLEDEHAAMIELIKGKTTTMPEAHSGEGIIFVSKAADRFSLHSHRIQLKWDRFQADVFVSQIRFSKGTQVKFSLLRSSRTTLESVFETFAPAEFDYEFSKTQIMVKLLKPEYISRSEAKRLLVNLDKFRVIELDYKNVTLLGQGFADEVYRVFASRYPDIKINTFNASPPIQAMIDHAINTSSKD